MNTFFQFYSPTNPLSIENYGHEPYTSTEAIVSKEEEENVTPHDLRPIDLTEQEIHTIADKISNKLLEIVKKQLTTA